MRIFLSGDTHSDWRKPLIERFDGHTFYDPTTCSDLSYPEMARVEREWIDESDIIFAYLSRSNPFGYGTVFEIGYAVANKKTIIYIDEKQVPSSKWVAEHVAFRFTDLDNGIEQLGKLISQGAGLTAQQVVDSLRCNEFGPLMVRELDDAVVRLIVRAFESTSP